MSLQLKMDGLTVLQTCGFLIFFAGAIVIIIGTIRLHGFSFSSKILMEIPMNPFRRTYWEYWANFLREPKSRPWYAVGYGCAVVGFGLFVVEDINNPIMLAFLLYAIGAFGAIFCLGFTPRRTTLKKNDGLRNGG